MKQLKSLLTSSILALSSVQISIASTWNCSNTDGLKATLSYEAKAINSSKIEVENLVVNFQNSDSMSSQISIPIGSIFDSTQNADAYIEKEFGASLSFVSYEADDGVRLPTPLLFPKYVVNFSGARNELLVIGLRTSTEYHFANCKKL